MIFSQELKLNKKNESDTDFNPLFQEFRFRRVSGILPELLCLLIPKMTVFFLRNMKTKVTMSFQFKIVLGRLDEERLFNYYFENLK
jgi:hypothetical protein